MGDREYMRGLIELHVPEALKQFDLVYPLPIDIDFDKDKEVDKYRLEGWGYLVGNKHFRKPETIPSDIKDILDEFFAKYRQ